ncbi:DUF58 domain-containing protein [Acetobacter nitrogenifigens]|uniref:DUF58 domain-containing protein n=2 Tax=Acetobacter nitrogenifigens TaxID=285268 RepID=A0A511XA89_9PROT|nr:DUF58 domain-containing protein [Acetobacter nitrogenifigens]GEN59859.1 hypothetical protein ANI02nite_17430 [Acetobacter nitrogenifigens DSM 23921 = NBRC 105050]
MPANTKIEAAREGFLSSLGSFFRPRVTGSGGGAPERRPAAPVLSMAAEAAALAARLPALVAEAEKIANTVSLGQHGRRRAGMGETFWQYRPSLPGEPVTRIDWRQSARSHRAYVRETEAEIAQTVYLWCDLSPSMLWSSSQNGDTPPLKRDRAILMLLALATLLHNGGERVRLLTPRGVAPLPAGASRIATKLAQALMAEQAAQNETPGSATLPLAAALPQHARLVIASDFLCLEDEIGSLLRNLAATPVRSFLLHIVDPAETTFPYSGRVRFSGAEAEPDLILPHVETLQRDYRAVFAEWREELRTLATATGHTLLSHVTDQAPAPALLALSEAIALRGDSMRRGA